MSVKLTEEELQILRDKFIGKRISVPITEQHKFGVPSETVSGVCEFIGYSSYFPNTGLQVTINRLPVRFVDHTKLKLINNGGKKGI